MAGDRPIFTNIPMLQEAGAKIGSALGEYQRRKKEEQYWNNLLAGVSTPAEMNTPLGREVWKKFLRNQLYAPLSQEGGYDVPLQDLDQRILQAQSFQTPEGYKDAEFFDKQRKHLYEQKKDYQEAFRNYEKDTLEKYFSKAKRSPLYQDLVRVLLEYQKNKDTNQFKHNIRNALRQVGIFDNRPLTRSDIERVLEGKALELLDIKEKGGSNPSTVEFKAMIRSFVNVLNDLEGNLQLLIPQALQARTANAYYDAFKKIKPKDFRTLEKYQEALGKEAKKILRKDKEFDALDEIGQGLGINTADIVKTSALTPLFEEIEEFNLPKNQPKPLESFSRGGYEERNVQPRDVSSSEPFIFNKESSYPPEPPIESRDPLNLESDYPINLESNSPQNNNLWELIGERAKNDGTHLGIKGLEGKAWGLKNFWNLVAGLNNARYNQYKKEGLTGEEILNRELDRNYDYVPSKYREMLAKKYREIPDKDEKGTYHFPNFQEVLEGVANKGWDYDPNKVSQTGKTLGNMLEWYNINRAIKGNKEKVLKSLGKAVGGTLLQEGLDRIPFLPKWLNALIAVGASEGIDHLAQYRPLKSEIKKIDKYTPESIANKTWTGDRLQYAQSEFPITREGHQSLSQVLNKRAEKVGAKMEGKSLLEMEAAVDKAYDKVNKVLKKYANSKKDIQPIVLKELNKEIAAFEKNMVNGTATAHKQTLLETLKKYKKSLKESRGVGLQGAIGEMKSWRQQKSAGYDPAVPIAQQKADYELGEIMTNVFERSVGKAVPEVGPLLKEATYLYKLHKDDLFLDKLAKDFTGSQVASVPRRTAKKILSDPEIKRDLKRILTPKEYYKVQKDINKYSDRMEKLSLAYRFRPVEKESRGLLKEIARGVANSPGLVHRKLLNRNIKSFGKDIRGPVIGDNTLLYERGAPLLLRANEKKKEKKRSREYKWKKREERLIDLLN